MIESKILAKYSQEGYRDYPEDTWEHEDYVADEDELYRLMVYLHKQSASTFNDYPLGGLFRPESLKFYKKKTTVVDGTVFTSIPTPITPPDFYEPAKNRFLSLIETAKVRLPKIRKAQDLRVKEQREYEKYKKLKMKFE